MAQGNSSAEVPNAVKETPASLEIEVEDKSNLECAVCLQTCIHPARLPCGHVFCFLCVKGVANQSKRCAMCRQEIPSDFLDHPQLLDMTLEEEKAQAEHLWFYEGKNGWWQYDERTCYELETAFKKEEKICELLIAGFLYVIDFQTMFQIRRNDPSRRRRIKRDLATIIKKGVAGLRLPDNQDEIGHRMSDTTIDLRRRSRSRTSVGSDNEETRNISIEYIEERSSVIVDDALNLVNRLRTLNIENLNGSDTESH